MPVKKYTIKKIKKKSVQNVTGKKSSQKLPYKKHSCGNGYYGEIKTVTKNSHFARVIFDKKTRRQKRIPLKVRVKFCHFCGKQFKKEYINLD